MSNPDEDSGEDDLVKGVPDEDEFETPDNGENGEDGGADGENGENGENGDNGENSGTDDNNGENGDPEGEYDSNFEGTAPTQSWAEGGEEGGDEGGEEEGERAESEGGSRGYPNESGDEASDGNFSGRDPVYSEDSMDPFAGTTEEGNVDVEGDAANRAAEDDDEDVDVDGDGAKTTRKSKEGFEDSDIDIGGESSRGPDEDVAMDTTPTNYEQEDEANKTPAKPAAPVAPAPIFEPEYEPLDFENGNILHKEAFYPEWEKNVCEQDEVEEILVPIRLDVAIDNNTKVQDTFIWNLKEKSITPDQYAEMLCIDLDLPSRAERLIADSIRQQLGEHRDLVPPIPSATARPVAATTPGALPECLVTIKVDLTVNQVLLHDQFEWDVNNPANAPEPFARSLCQDLGLSREFESSIAHAIREQLAFHAQYTVPVLQQTHARQHLVITSDRCVRDETELPVWTPIVQNVTLMQRAQAMQQQTTNQLAGSYTYTPQGPIRHSSRLKEAASQPYSLRASTTPNR